MLRLFVSFVLLLGGVVTAHPAWSQVSGRAYAPEDLQQLRVSERIRVLEKEYREQSGGRELPDDQLDFYLDQIESGWTFSRIKQDIAQSLRGTSGGWNPPGSGWNARKVICSSVGQRYRECRTPFQGRAQLVEQISNATCREGYSWGSRVGIVWVNHGCRARFQEDGKGWGAPGNAEVLRCESHDKRYRECREYFRGPPEIYRNLSKNECRRDRDWGHRGDIIWVRDGCKAEFVDSFRPGAGGGWGNAGYRVTCASQQGEMKSCAWDWRYGQPYLLQEMSNRACVQGRTWGYKDRGGIWVTRGCRAMFGPR